jgi:hypothetical protein
MGHVSPRPWPAFTAFSQEELSVNRTSLDSSRPPSAKEDEGQSFAVHR